MRLLVRLLSAGLLLLTLFPVTAVFADYKTDYEYQNSQYRQHYTEYSILKKDYLENPTLDNQQKAILAAKAALKARDLAKASYSAHLLSLITASKTNYAPLNPFITSLSEARTFFALEAEKSQSIITPADLKKYTERYSRETLPHDRSLRTGVVVNKVARLISFQVDCKNALDIILPKLPSPYPTALKARIDDLQFLGNSINSEIDTFSASLSTEESLTEIDTDSYFDDKTEFLQKVQKQQLRWINGLLDIDINYAHS